MDIISILLFFIYSIIILGILIYVSPLLSALVMIIIPLALVFIVSEYALSFLTIIQFSYSSVQIYNLHILLFIWSAFLGVIAYAEVLSWYLLKGSETKPMSKEPSAAQGEKVKAPVSEFKAFFQKLYKILKGEKIKSKP